MEYVCHTLFKDSIRRELLKIEDYPSASQENWKITGIYLFIFSNLEFIVWSVTLSNSQLDTRLRIPVFSEVLFLLIFIHQLVHEEDK